jgi:tetratricopeptide (TPR) repeat protein
MSARTLSRHNANTGLNAILFEIEIIQRTTLFDFHDDNYLLFPVGSTFRVCSIDQAPDGVWYIKLNHTVEQDLEVVIQQLQYEVNYSLNWLTFGHFLRRLNLVNEATEYYNFWLRTLATDHPDIFSIHYHLGILYAEIKEDSKALHHMNEVLQFSQPIIKEIPRCDPQVIETEELYRLPVNQSMIFGNIADIHDKMGKHNKALEFYEKALAITTDQRYRRKFHYKHNTLKNMLEPCFSSDNRD